MDIAFHYCAIKALARLAGFIEEKAQIIAEYSQFVDDYTARDTITVDWWPLWAEEIGLVSASGRIDLVTTGFETWQDMSHLIYEKNRNNYLIPFHFITPNKLVDKDDVSTTVPATITSQDISIAAVALREVINRRNQNDETLVRLGMILHVFADTYAHQGYSGQPTDNNKQYIKKAERYNENGAPVDVTEIERGFASHIMACGHSYSGHCPDNTYLKYELSKEGDTGPLFYGRDNRDEFIKASRQIYDAMVALTGAPITVLPFSFDNDVKPFLHAMFTQAYNVQSKEGFAALCHNYQEQFSRTYGMYIETSGGGDAKFHYDKTNVLSRHYATRQEGGELTHKDLEALLRLDAAQGDELPDSLKGTVKVSREFWYFTLYAAEHRDKVRHS